jgi:uncharacterized protein
VTKIRKSGNSSMVTDRRGSGGGGGGGGLGGLGGGGGIPLPGKLGGGLVGIIVALAIAFLPRLLNGAGTTNSAADTGGATTSASECDSDLAQVICGATEDVENFWVTEMPKAFGNEYEITQTVFFSGATSTGCGQASAQTGPFYCPADHLVYFDLDFLQQLQDQFGAQGDLAAAYIVAHEYGHHIQNLVGTNARVQQAGQNDPGNANQYSVALELQADCYGGVWAHDAKSRGQFETDSEIDEAIEAARAVGDDRIQQKTQGRIDPESFTHGTSEQRATWFKRGYSTGDPLQCDTFKDVLG